MSLASLVSSHTLEGLCDVTMRFSFGQITNLTDYVGYNKFMASRNYAGAIWTNHALERLDQRGLSQPMAGQTFMYPEHTERGKQPGTTEFTRKYDNSKVTVIAKQNEKGEWIILSCWIDPPLPGSIDIHRRKEYEEYKRAGFWKRLWMDIKKDLSW